MEKLNTGLRKLVIQACRFHTFMYYSKRGDAGGEVLLLLVKRLVGLLIKLLNGIWIGMFL